MSMSDDNKPNDSAPQVGKLEKFNRGVVKTRNTMLAIWAYLFYGALLAIGIFMVATGAMEGLIFIGVAAVLFALYWLFGYVICCR